MGASGDCACADNVEAKQSRTGNATAGATDEITESRYRRNEEGSEIEA
jgi:hypothetical protein